MPDQPEQLKRVKAALAGRYTLERELGAGGMATVYLAEDLKHKRKVALKVLKPELAAVLGAERFVQEITTTASLQHPHILPLFDSGEAGGFLYYVMPFVEGETLRDKLDREKQLGIEEAVRITTEVADALDYAHRNNVIHRDIKPENILLHDGRPMVADFGIALAVSAAAGGRMTETGLSLGTPHYMSPEQATAEKDLTNRSDIYSLGAVLYEMLTGSPPHVGSSAQQIIMKIVTEEAQPVTKVRRAVPPNVAAAATKALEKLPADRFESARAFADALGNPAFTAPGAIMRGPARASARSTVSARRFYAALALSAVLLVVAIVGWMRGSPSPPASRQRVVMWRHSLPPFLAPGDPLRGNQAAIAPDGSSIVFSDSNVNGFQLMHKLRQHREPTPLAGTPGGRAPFFSPDGAWIGYLTVEGKLRKMPAAGGGSVTIAENANALYHAAAWLDDETIIYVDDQVDLRRVSADGGTSEVIQKVGTERRLNTATLWPLPGSHGFLYTACAGNCAIQSAVFVYDFAADSARLLFDDAAGAWYAHTGYLLYTDRAGGLYAAPFDPDRLTLRGGAVPVIDDVAPTAFTLSGSGAVLYSTYASSRTPAELVWVTRDGAAQPVDPEWQGRFEYPALSPDGEALAVSLQEESIHLWIRRSDGGRQRLTNEGSVNWRPTWMPDGRSVAYISNQDVSSQDDFDVYLSRADGTAPAELILNHDFGVWEIEHSLDGRWQVLRADETGGDSNIRARRLDGDTTLVPVVADRSTSTQVALSPDSHWLAYSSDETGRFEVYVVSFPDAQAKRLVSRDGGTEPRWAHSGRELFFKSAGMLVVVEVPPGPIFTPGVPRPLFSVAGYRGAINRPQYDVTPDDRRFVMIRELGANAPGELIYVENWFEELKAKVGN